MRNDPLERHRNDESEYVQCENCGRGQTAWSVKVDGEGDVVAVECKRCGGSTWERVPWQCGCV